VAFGREVVDRILKDTTCVTYSSNTGFGLFFNEHEITDLDDAKQEIKRLKALVERRDAQQQERPLGRHHV
jgi:hypothetical protein